MTSRHLPSAARAHAELAWKPTAFEDALTRTIADQHSRQTQPKATRP